jgi:hypothetical protein
MSDQEQTVIPSAAEVETELLRRDAETAKALDGYAQFFMLYITRFKEQLKFMSKKELIKLIISLSDSEFSDKDDVSLMIRTANSLNLKSLIRTIGNAVEAPLNEDAIKQFSKKEKQLFNILEDLFAQKYVGSISASTKKHYDNKDLPAPRVVTEVVNTTHDEKEFNKRKQVEKDAYSTANQLLLVKTLMAQDVIIEHLDSNSEEIKSKEEMK